MNQFKDVFLGREKRDYTRATTSQKCMRVSGKHNDLDNVGPSLRHHTFFEMLGNFSFGDYFKEDALRFAWTLLTDVWKMPKDRLVVSIFKGENGIPRDDEAYAIWRQFVPADRILELGEDDNFWQMGDTGPCGRCSEIYYVRGTGHDPEIEVWNNVFMEFERSADGTLTPLPAPSIDTGMGLERVTAVLQDKDSNYDTDLFTPILAAIGEHCRRPRTAPMSAADVSMRVVADHIRATTFLIADGVIPSNEWRGYVLRKIMRRAMRHGRRLGLDKPFLYKMVAVLAREMGDAYPELRTNREMIEKTILAEEHRFEAVLTEGLPRLEAEIAKVLGTKSKVLPGDAAFKLYDTFGMPYDFIDDTAGTQGVTVDREAGSTARWKASATRRARRAPSMARRRPEFTFDGRTSEPALKRRRSFRRLYQPASHRRADRGALRRGAPAGRAALDGRDRLRRARADAVLSRSGRPGVRRRDASTTRPPAPTAAVEGLVRIRPGLPRAHHVRVTSGALGVRDIVTAQVDAEVRNATRRNHTATHLLHAALRQVLGTHVKQAGSLVTPDRLRFDFVHFQPVTREELDRIERIVNEQIRRNAPVTTDVRSTQEAIASGAMALFGEKYGDTVRVVSVPGFSLELCGGTHVSATGDIGFFVILSEGGVAAGVRRIEATTGAGAVEWAQHQREALHRIISTLHVNEDQAVDTIEKLQSEVKRLARETTQLKTKLATGASGGSNASGASGASGGANDDVVEVAGVRLTRRRVTDLDKHALRSLSDSLKAKIKSGVVVIASANDGKVQIVVSVTPDLTAAREGRPDREGARADRRRRRRRTPRLRRSRRQATR